MSSPSAPDHGAPIADARALAVELGRRIIARPKIAAHHFPDRVPALESISRDKPEQYLYVPPEGGIYRLYLRNRRRCYLKVRDRREMVEERLPPVERVLTLPRAYQCSDENVRSKPRSAAEWRPGGPKRHSAGAPCLTTNEQ